MKHPIVLRALLLAPAISCSVRQAMAQAPKPEFEVATVKFAAPDDPNNGSWSLPGIGLFWAKHLSMPYLMQLAYGINASQIANKPSWFDDTLYDIEAKPEAGVKLNRDELKPRLQALLQDRFHLVAHMEIRPVRGFALVVAKGGPHMTLTRGDHFEDFSENTGAGQMRGFNWSMAVFVKYLTSAAGFPVVDRTGLAGRYDVAFSYARDDPAESALPGLAGALKDATGLELKAGKVPVETVVIDSIEKVPAPN